MTAVAVSVGRPRRARLAKFVRDNSWTLGLLVFLAVLLVITKIINPSYGPTGVQGLANSVLYLALATAAQAVIVLSGGIDLSVASVMALTSCITARLMQGQSPEFGVAVVIGVLAIGLLLGAINGTLIVVTRVPDIIVTLATSFVWAGFALLVLQAPGGQTAQWLKDLVIGPLFSEWVPKAAVALVIVVAVIWIPVSRSRWGLSLYAVGSNQLAAFRSGVSVGRTKIFAYTLGGLFASLGGLALAAGTGVGTPVPEPTYVLLSIAAVVLGGVSLAGGVGSVFGPLIAVVVLELIRTDIIFLKVNSNYALVLQGLILIAVLVAASLNQLRRSRA
jgi:ribose transport system permease protein